MTYNFDPDRWYENELLVIQRNFKAGRMSEKEYNQAIEELDQKLEEMWERLNRSYQIPK
jgi:cobyric acid synthase